MSRCPFLFNFIQCPYGLGSQTTDRSSSSQTKSHLQAFDLQAKRKVIFKPNDLQAKRKVIFKRSIFKRS